MTHIAGAHRGHALGPMSRPIRESEIDAFERKYGYRVDVSD